MRRSALLLIAFLSACSATVKPTLTNGRDGAVISCDGLLYNWKICDKAAKELEPRARFAKVNVDEEPAIAARFGIRGIPTLIAFEKGKVAKQHSGLVDLNFLKGLAHTD